MGFVLLGNWNPRMFWSSRFPSHTLEKVSELLFLYIFSLVKEVISSIILEMHLKDFGLALVNIRTSSA